jgi:hypothetical protein
MARHDHDGRDMSNAHGRYTASEQADDRRHAERRGHGLYGYRPEEAPGFEREGAHYDPDGLYRRDRYNSGYGGDAYGRREYYRHERHEPYANRPFPGDHGRYADDGIRERDREAWRRPSSWFGVDLGEERDHHPEERGYRWRLEHGYRGAGGYADRRGDADHRGRGPKGYLRPDERIREDVCDCLTDDPYVDAGEIEVSVGNGEVTLSGTIESRAMRRRAEELAESLSGVKHVQNNLRIGGRSSGA